MADLPYESIPPAPERMSGAAILTRLMDGIGFRYRWATEGLEDGDLAFRPAPDCRSLGELLAHVHGLLRRVGLGIGVEPSLGCMGTIEGFAVRRATVELARVLRERLASMGDSELAASTMRTGRGETYPVWNMVNGPLSDALTHIGQIASWRRIMGKPVPVADVFRGLPPQNRS